MSSLHSPSTTRRSTPSRRGRAGLATAAVLAAVVPFASACGAGFTAASENVKYNAGSGTLGDLSVNNVWVIIDPATGNAEVIGAVANTGTASDQLTGVQAGSTPATVVASKAGGTAPLGVSVAGDAVSIAANSSVSFGQPGSPQLQIQDSGLDAGDLTPVTLTFAQAGTLTVTAEIEPNSGEFAEYNPNPPATPTPTPSASASGSASATPSGSASGTGASSSASAHAGTNVSTSTSASPSSSKK